MTGVGQGPSVASTGVSALEPLESLENRERLIIATEGACHALCGEQVLYRDLGQLPSTGGPFAAISPVAFFGLRRFRTGRYPASFRGLSRLRREPL